jgi:hypothetical protein
MSARQHLVHSCRASWAARCCLQPYRAALLDVLHYMQWYVAVEVCAGFTVVWARSSPLAVVAAPIGRRRCELFGTHAADLLNRHISR